MPETADNPHVTTEVVEQQSYANHFHHSPSGATQVDFNGSPGRTHLGDQIRVRQHECPTSGTVEHL